MITAHVAFTKLMDFDVKAIRAVAYERDGMYQSLDVEGTPD
jgi:hypothetical protein